MLAAKTLKLNLEDIEELERDKALDPTALLALDADTRARVVWDQLHPDHPGQAVRFRLLQQGIGGPSPAGAHLRAIVKARSLRANKSMILDNGLPSGPLAKSDLLLPLPPEAGLSRPGWTGIRSGAIGGRTRAVVVLDPAGQHLLAASPSGGIWRTTDGGSIWTPVDDFMANLAVSTIAQSPAVPTTLFAGTGEGYYNIDAIKGAGIFESTNGGDDWSPIKATRGFEFVNRIAISSDGRIILAATRTGIQRSPDAGATWAPVPMAGLELFDVAFQPGSNVNAIASGQGRMLVTNDGGGTWIESTGFPERTGRIEFTYARANPQIVYASVDDCRGSIYRSDDSGVKFELQNRDTNYLGEQGWYANAIWAGDPTDADLVVVGGLDVWRSTNGGKDLTRISLWDNDKSTHADQHVVVAGPGFDGRTNRTVWVGNDGGVYRVADIRAVTDDTGWESLNKDYGATQFYAVAISPKTGTIIGGTQDNGTLRYSAKDGWSTMFGGDGGFVQVASDGTFYGEYVFLDLHRSTDDGRKAEYISGHYWDGNNWAWRAPPNVIVDAMNEDANFIAPFVMVPNKRASILAGGKSLWRTNDADAKGLGPQWTSIKDPASDLISAIAVRTSDTNVVWVCHNDGAVYVTHDAEKQHPQWQRIGARSKLPSAYCHHIEIDQANPKTVYLTFGREDNHNVWRTSDEGLTWVEIGTGLPEAPVRSLTIHPTKKNFLYVATDVGVFGTENGGGKWSATNEGPTSCAVDGFAWANGLLYAATHGRGLFTIKL